MMGIANRSLEEPSQESASVPYPPGWVNRFIDWIKRLPIPSWLFYAILLAGCELAIYASRWIDGSAAFGTFGPFFPYGLIGLYGVGNMAAIHYIDKMAGKSFDDFLPALASSEADAERLRYELLTMPRRETRLVGILGFVLGVPMIFMSDLALPLAQNSVSFAVLVVVACFGFVVTAELLYHTVRQLSVVSHIHSVAAQIDILNPAPLYAFSRLSSLTGLFFLVNLWIDLALNPETFENVGLIALNICLILIALAAFVLPLVGMHRRLVEEKQLLQVEINHYIKSSMKELFAQLDAAEFASVDLINKAISGLLTTQDFVTKIPTWPWSAQTFTFFLSALIAPLVVFVVQMVLSSLLGVN